MTQKGAGEMDHQTKARRIVEGLRLYRRGLRQVATGDEEAAKASAREIAALCLADCHALNMQRLRTLPTATEADAEQYRGTLAALTDEALNTLRAILEGGRDEEERHAQRRAAAKMPWQRRGIMRDAESNLATFVAMVRYEAEHYGEAEALATVEAILEAEEVAA